MARNKLIVVPRSPSKRRINETQDQIPATLLNALFEEGSTGRKLPRAVIVGEDEVIVYQACKSVSADDLKQIDQLTACVTSREEITDISGKKIHKVILAAWCDGEIRLQALQRGINVLTKDELRERRNTLVH